MSTTKLSENALGKLTGPVPPSGPEGGGDEVLRTVSLPGLTLTVRARTDRRSDLPPAVFVHGLGGSSQHWSALMRQLADTVDGEALDLPGFGYSPPPDDGNYRINGHARAVVRFLEASQSRPVHLFGNSLGGAVATRIAALRPDLVRTLTLVSPALPEIPPQPSAWPTALGSVSALVRLYLRATRDWPPERRAHALFELCYGDPTAVSEQDIQDAAREFERRLALPYHWDAMIRSTRGIVDAYTLGGQHSLWRQAERVLAPTLLVYGGRDKLVSIRKARRAAKTFRDARLLTIPDGGHVAMMEHPHMVARSFRELLAETVASSDGGSESGAR